MTELVGSCESWDAGHSAREVADLDYNRLYFGQGSHSWAPDRRSLQAPEVPGAGAQRSPFSMGKEGEARTSPAPQAAPRGGKPEALLYDPGDVSAQPSARL